MGVRPRFSVVLPVRNRADVIGRTVAGVLAQTFAGHEVIVVDDGSDDDTAAAVRAVADGRVRLVHREPHGAEPPVAVGLAEARGRWAAVLEPDVEVAPGWLARLGRLIDATDARFVSCGGQQQHRDGTCSEILPSPHRVGDATGTACLRPGAYATECHRLVEAGMDGAASTAAGLGGRALDAAVAAGAVVAHTPEPLVRWIEPVTEAADSGDALRLRWALQGLDALSRTPIPDATLLARYATAGGVAAARLRHRHQARSLFGIARSARPDVARLWARWAVALLPPVADRVWDPADA